MDLLKGVHVNGGIEPVVLRKHAVENEIKKFLNMIIDGKRNKPVNIDALRAYALKVKHLREELETLDVIINTERHL